MIDRSDSPEPTHDDLRRSLRGHLEGLESWGVSRIFGEPIAPAPSAPLPRQSDEQREPDSHPGRPGSQDRGEPARLAVPVQATLEHANVVAA